MAAYCDNLTWRDRRAVKESPRKAGTFAKRNGLRRRGELRRGRWAS